mmetsp:Transcript_10213/g.26759  ORF Transcript_10213/g.26759 Transcript_10213/m.26759 type:complete len:548 (-) Transcript_10213:175-1818(-)
MFIFYYFSLLDDDTRSRILPNLYQTPFHCVHEIFSHLHLHETERDIEDVQRWLLEEIERRLADGRWESFSVELLFALCMQFSSLVSSMQVRVVEILKSLERCWPFQCPVGRIILQPSNMDFGFTLEESPSDYLFWFDESAKGSCTCLDAAIMSCVDTCDMEGIASLQAALQLPQTAASFRSLRAMFELDVSAEICDRWHHTGIGAIVSADVEEEERTDIARLFLCASLFGEFTPSEQSSFVQLFLHPVSAHVLVNGYRDKRAPVRNLIIDQGSEDIIAIRPSGICTEFDYQDADEYSLFDMAIESSTRLKDINKMNESIAALLFALPHVVVTYNTLVPFLNNIDNMRKEVVTAFGEYVFLRWKRTEGGKKFDLFFFVSRCYYYLRPQVQSSIIKLLCSREETKVYVKINRNRVAFVCSLGEALFKHSQFVCSEASNIRIPVSDEEAACMSCLDAAVLSCVHQQDNNKKATTLLALKRTLRHAVLSTSSLIAIFQHGDHGCERVTSMFESHVRACSQNVEGYERKVLLSILHQAPDLPEPSPLKRARF